MITARLIKKASGISKSVNQSTRSLLIMYALVRPAKLIPRLIIPKSSMFFLARAILSFSVPCV